MSNAFVITCVHNEAFFLPLWIKYYGSQLGVKNLFIVNHGSTDLSTYNLSSVNVITVPRTVQDDAQRVTFMSYMHAALLAYYDAGFVVDVDEFLIVDPGLYKNLNDFAIRCNHNHVVAQGLELFHIRAVEQSFQSHVPILMQRRHVKFNSWMCKRSFGRGKMRFGGGFHTSDKEVVFDHGFYLIHVKYFDYSYSLLRQSITKGWEYKDSIGTHARRPVSYIDEVFSGIDHMYNAGKINAQFNFQHETNLCLEKTRVNASGEYDFNVDGGFHGNNLHILPYYMHFLF